MADIKAAFFDLDGTLISFKTHEIVPSAAEALRLLRANGIHPIMATGRPHYLVSGVEWDAFDAHMTFNGNYSFDGDTIIRSVSLGRDTLDAIAQDVRKGLYPVMYQLADEAFTIGSNELTESMAKTIGGRIRQGSFNEVGNREVYQLNLFVDPKMDEEILARVPNMELVRWTPLAADGIPAGSDKRAGVLAMLDYYGLSPEQAIAFGDGGNDVPMLEACGIGVAMGNGMAEAKEAADMVSASVDDDGVFLACRKLGLI